MRPPGLLGMEPFWEPRRRAAPRSQKERPAISRPSDAGHGLVTVRPTTKTAMPPSIAQVRTPQRGAWHEDDQLRARCQGCRKDKRKDS
jgi:hypothetical protein